jgi:hypothetical protein
MAIDLQPMAAGGVWLQPYSTEVPPTYVVHPAHITRLTLDGWRPVTDPRSELMAQQAAKKAAEEAKEKERQEKEDAQAKRIAELEAMVHKLLAAQSQAPSEAKAEETKPTTRRKAE